MKKFFAFLLIFFFIFSYIFVGGVSAVTANPQIIETTQPDGTKIKIRIRGDEFYHWTEDADGYTIVQDNAKYWTYAQKDNFGELKPSQNVVGKVSPKTLNIKKSLMDGTKLLKAKEIRKNSEAERRKVLKRNLSDLNSLSKSDSGEPKRTSVTGEKINFVLLVQYNDYHFNKEGSPFYGMSDDAVKNEFDNLFNTVGYNKNGAVGSVKDYFTEASYGQMNFVSVISPVVTFSNNASYFADSLGDDSFEHFRAAVAAALQQLNADGYDFKNKLGRTPDAFTVVHAGGGAENGNSSFLWSHQWQLASALNFNGVEFNHYDAVPAGRGISGNNGITRIGVICHETLHIFGLPDLYDTTYSSYGLGNFCVMAGGEWNGNSGTMPCHPSAWCKKFLGWITPQTARNGINYIGQSATDKTAFYKFAPSTFDSTEYFLMENRQSAGFDKGLPGTTRGILIYHVDESKDSNDDPAHYLVDLEEADGTANWTQDHLATYTNGGLDSDYFRSGNLTVFNDTCVSSPNSKSYDGTLSGIKISGISSSNFNMYFVYGDMEVLDDVSGVLSYPNPARNGSLYITNIPASRQDFSAEIFTMKGNLVRYFSENDIEDVELGSTVFGRIKWDLKNDKGENVAPGVYLVLVKANSSKKTFKAAVIR